MPSIIDVAKYVLHIKGHVTPFRLHRLCYYCQARVLAYDLMPLFPEDFQAWAGGPVCAELYQFHKDHLSKGIYILFDGDLGKYDDSALTEYQQEQIDEVLSKYGNLKTFQLSINIHDEWPWVEARKWLELGERCENTISKKTMSEYYASQIEYTRDRSWHPPGERN
ncbi:MAG: DUF4065 domain-containing protein [Clostridiales bacterium]|nr:DUF4065 domain-containing protein [Clostridiales bacterium]